MNDEHDNSALDRSMSDVDLEEALDDNQRLADILFSLVAGEWDNWCAPGDEIMEGNTGVPLEGNDGETQSLILRSGVLLIVTARVINLEGVPKS